MPIQINIQGTNYNLPVQGDAPPWGDSLQNILQALVNVVNSQVTVTDILTSTFNIANNISTPTNVVGLYFDPTKVRGAVIQYAIYRNSQGSELCEVGFIYIGYKSVAGTWELSNSAVGNSGVSFNILQNGQVQYTSSSMPTTNYTGKMKFSAKTFSQA